jgi:hypothetical protein
MHLMAASAFPKRAKAGAHHDFEGALAVAPDAAGESVVGRRLKVVANSLSGA